MLTFFSNAQEEVYSTIPYDFGRWIGEGYMVPDGDKAYVFADACNVRKEPKPNAEIVGKLYIGTEVEILRRMEVELTLNGVESTWLKVKSDTIVGYVWGGTLTNQVLELPDKRLALWGITKYVDTDTSRFATASIRIAANKVMVSSVEFRSVGGVDGKNGYLQLFETPLLDSVTLCLGFNSSGYSCGAYSYIYYVVEVNGKLQNIAYGFGMGDSGMLYDSRDIIFPLKSEEDDLKDYHYEAKKNQLLIVESNGEETEDCLWKEYITVKRFEWKNGELQKYCEE
jgi:hypothetical protein